MHINEIQDEIIEEFELFEEWLDKYDYIIELGKNLPMIDDRYKDEEHLIKGCLSRVWLHADQDGEVVVFTADSDAIITRGIIALLIRVLSNQRPEDIANSDLYFVDKIGLREHLSQSRANGLLSMIKQLKFYGIALGSR